ncbi:MAG TPA: hypothetical protein VGN12_18820 [Pirellulales bacterium]|jgi:hypothetical protein
MKKLGILALLVAALGSAVVGCEPAKKKTEAPKAAETAAPAETPAAEAPKTEAPAEAPK